ncbi:unnamed protein product [Heligmosomoides polygyrus]|uniref:Uncharacterized protein n=1 Tax=Heligmosomoides polygyrus TaxID=6339 RepID=A0A3P8G279_HELPZ|nr:unnamed protein product [Heligmosomoides polygyrus]
MPGLKLATSTARHARSPTCSARLPSRQIRLAMCSARLLSRQARRRRLGILRYFLALICAPFGYFDRM